MDGAAIGEFATQKSDRGGGFPRTRHEAQFEHLGNRFADPRLLGDVAHHREIADSSDSVHQGHAIPFSGNAIGAPVIRS